MIAQRVFPLGDYFCEVIELEEMNMVASMQLYLALPEDEADMAIFTDVRDCMKYLAALGENPMDYMELPLNPGVQYPLIYKVFDGYVRYFRGEITLLEHTVFTEHTYVDPANIICPSQNTKEADPDTNVPIAWYCKLYIRVELAAKLPSYSEYVHQTIKSGIENFLVHNLGGRNNV